MRSALHVLYYRVKKGKNRAIEEEKPQWLYVLVRLVVLFEVVL
jgi:hypothetical protein